MEANENTTTWLDRLQKESWNLELLVSGFAIFLLVQGREMVTAASEQLTIHYSHGLFHSFVMMFIFIGYIATALLIFNLIGHIFMRGIWIGAIGLRSVQNERDFSAFNYTKKITEELEQRVPTLDKLIMGLDNVCSVIFGFTFLIIFMLLSFFAFLLWGVLLSFIIFKVNSWVGVDNYDRIFEITNLVVTLIYIFGGLIYFLDTISLGMIKRWKWSQRIYFPIYRFYSWITFSHFYRTIYYHFLGRFSRWGISLAIIFYLCLFFLSPFFEINSYRFYPDNETDNELFSNHFDDLRADDSEIGTTSIPSRNITTSFLPLFIRYQPAHTEQLLKHCTNYEPSKKSDFVSGIMISSRGFAITDPGIEEENPQKLLNCLSAFYKVYLNDSLQPMNDAYFYTQPGKLKEKGLTTMLDIRSLPTGKNTLRITRQVLDTAEVWIEEDYSTIPFWKEN